MIGDSLVDIEFGRRLGMTSIFIDSKPHHQRPSDKPARDLANLCFSSLEEAANALLVS
jgi:phosphoglycolate phosphatase-like HAD superfamily hydrolase